jgi:hypothetical protein
MSLAPRLRAAWGYVKEYAASVMAAALMFGGINQLLSALRYTAFFGGGRLINEVIRRAFPGRFLLPNYGGPIPWLFHLRTAALGIMLIAVGTLIGLLANIRNQRLPARQHCA